MPEVGTVFGRRWFIPTRLHPSTIGEPPPGDGDPPPPFPIDAWAVWSSAYGAAMKVYSSLMAVAAAAQTAALVSADRPCPVEGNIGSRTGGEKAGVIFEVHVRAASYCCHRRRQLCHRCRHCRLRHTAATA